jgi:hypothetical protein
MVFPLHQMERLCIHNSVTSCEDEISIKIGGVPLTPTYTAAQILHFHCQQNCAVFFLQTIT